MKLFEKLKISFLVSIILISQINQIFKINADNLSDIQDVFEVMQPGANTKVSGNVDIRWRSYDDDSTFVPYTIYLLDSATCKNSITTLSSDNGLSFQTSQNIFSFNSLDVLNSNNLNDGKYCIKVCAAFQDNSTNYSACNSRNLNIVNNNKLPLIESEPDLDPIEDGEDWEYEVIANDIDNDNLNYYLVYGPNFLTMNNSSGLLSTVDSYQAIPNGQSKTYYRVVIGVDDGISGVTTQEFQLAFIKFDDFEEVIEEEEEPPIINQPSVINFISPLENEEISGKYLFKWKISDEDEIKDSFASIEDTNGNTIKQIYNLSTDGQKDSVETDTTLINNGEYFLRILVVDSEGIEISKLSKVFSINNKTEEPSNESPLIINLSPANSSETFETKPKISGEFASVPGIKIRSQTLLVEVDEKDLSSLCSVNELGFECVLIDDLTLGEHNLRIRITDDANNIGLSESKFKIIEEVLEPTSYSNEIPILGFSITRDLLLLLVLFCCLILLLLIIPWVLIRIWRRNTTKKISTEVKVENNTYPTFYDTSATAASFDEFQSNQIVEPVPVIANPNIEVNYYNPVEKPVEYIPQQEQFQTAEIIPVVYPTTTIQPEQTFVEPDKSTYVEPTFADNSVDLSHMDSAKLASNENTTNENTEVPPQTNY